MNCVNICTNTSLGITSQNWSVFPNNERVVIETEYSVRHMHRSGSNVIYSTAGYSAEEANEKKKEGSLSSRVTVSIRSHARSLNGLWTIQNTTTIAAGVVHTCAERDIRTRRANGHNTIRRHAPPYSLVHHRAAIASETPSPSRLLTFRILSGRLLRCGAREVSSASNTRSASRQNRGAHSPGPFSHLKTFRTCEIISVCNLCGAYKSARVCGIFVSVLSR